MRARILIAVGTLLGSVGCIELHPDPPPPLGAVVDDEGPEMGPDVGPEMGVDVGPEMGVDVGPEMGVDVGPEMGPDVGPEMGPDVGPEMGVDVGADACVPADELCNGVDDDCDGLTDEGLLNACGGCGVEPEEVCDGQDDDCDGFIDEDAGCRDVLCGPPDARPPRPPCNGAPAGTEIPRGWVYVPPGDVIIGADQDVGTLNGPAFDAHVSYGFLMMQTEVTRGQWAAVVDARQAEVPGLPPRPSDLDERRNEGVCAMAGQDDDCPLQNINWWEALWLANALSEAAGLTPCHAPAQLAACTGPPVFIESEGRVGLDCNRNDPASAFSELLWPEIDGNARPADACDGIRLPTEAEWLRAVAGEDLPAVPEIGAPMGGDAPTRLGLYGMAGGVFEWLADSSVVFVSMPAGIRVRDPLAPRGLLTRVSRGGTRNDGVQLARRGRNPNDGINSLGVRFVRSLDVDVNARARSSLGVISVQPTVTPDTPGVIRIGPPAGDGAAYAGYFVAHSNSMGAGPDVRPFDPVDGPDNVYEARPTWELVTHGRPVQSYCGTDAGAGHVAARFLHPPDPDDPTAPRDSVAWFFGFDLDGTSLVLEDGVCRAADP